jgi:PPM family protein phosphatase
MEIAAAVLTHEGKVRDHNEDCVTFVRQSDADALANHGVLAVVADGMGGHKAGEQASRIAADIIARAYFDSRESPRRALLSAIASANHAVYETAAGNPAWKGMGTTCVAVVICRDLAWWAWVGDSRLYLFRRGEIFRLTEDHTVVQDMVRRGWMTQQEAETHADRNVLERAIGTRETVQAGVCDSAMRLEEGDRLLLCSDGLHDVIRDRDLAACLSSRGIAEGGEHLLQLALERGGPDNISLVLMEAKTKTPGRRPATTREHVLA